MTGPAIVSAQPCIWCGSELKHPNAPMCAACKLWQELRSCSVCSQSIPHDATNCIRCKAPQAVFYKTCTTCQARMPKDADRCNACTSFQNWRRHVPYAYTTALLLGLLAAAISSTVVRVWNFRHRHSDTSFVVAEATSDFIVLTVANTGRSASLLRRFRLEFGELPIEPVDLRVVPADREAGKTYIPPGASTVRLQTPGITPCDVTKEQIRDLLNREPEVKLMIWIKESDDPAEGPWTKVAAKIPASFLRPFILERIADD